MAWIRTSGPQRLGCAVRFSKSTDLHSNSSLPCASVYFCLVQYFPRPGRASSKFKAAYYTRSIGSIVLFRFNTFSVSTNFAPVPSELSFPLALIACCMPLRDPSRRTWDALGYLRASVTMNLSVWLCSRLLTSLLYSRIANPARSRRVLDHNCHQPTTHQVPPHLFAELMRTIDKADLYRREGNRVTGLETTQKPTGEKLRSLARVYPPPTSSSVGDRANFSTRPLSLSALKKSTETDLWRFVRNYVSKTWLRVLKVFPRPCPPFFSPVYSYASVVRILLLSMTRTMQLLLRTHAKRAGSIVAGALKRRDLLQMPGERDNTD